MCDGRMPSLITALPDDTARSAKAGDVMTSTTRAPARRLFRLRCEAPEIHVRRRGEIGKDRPHCDRLIELLRVYLVERIVGSVMGVEIIKPVLAQRYQWHADFLEFADILPAAKGWPAI